MTGAFTIGSPNRTKETPLSRDTNLIARWTFDEASGNALDYSGNGYHATLNGGVSRVTTTGNNKAMYYDGTGYIATPSFAIPNTGIITVETWMKSSFTAVKYQTILGDASQSSTIGYIFINRYANVNDLEYQYADGAAVNGKRFINFFQSLDNQWVHIIVICDYTNKTVKAYRNGVQFGATLNLQNTPQFPSTNRAKFIGSYNTNANTYKITDGSIDEVRIYNRGLSAEEVSSIYNATKSKYGF